MTGLFGGSEEPKPEKLLKDQILYQSANLLVIDLDSINFELEDLFRMIDNFLNQGHKFLYKKASYIVFQKFH